MPTLVLLIHVVYFYGQVYAAAYSRHSSNTTSFNTSSCNSAFPRPQSGRIGWTPGSSRHSSESVVATPKIGDYIASGLGLSEDASETRSSTFLATNTTSSITRLSDNLRNETSAPLSTLKAKIPQTTNATGFPFLSTTAIQNITRFQNHSLNVESCWSKWSSFWDGVVVTETFSRVDEEVGPWSEILVTISTFGTETETWGYDGFDYTTFTSTFSVFTTEAFPTAQVFSSIETYYITTTEYPSGPTVSPSAPFTDPACSLPSYVPQCQSAWENYAVTELSSVDVAQPTCLANWNISNPCSTSFAIYNSAVESLNSLKAMQRAPSCTQAIIGSTFCSSLQDAYMSSWIAATFPYLVGPATSPGEKVTAETVPGGSTLYSSYFPASSTIAPNCTVGCAHCAITGGMVRLLYWPATETLLLNMTTGILATDTQPLTAFAFGTSLVSPTVYISYSSLYASDSCSGIGTTLSPTIIPIPTSLTLSSLWAMYPGLEMYTASFNYTDLNTPVPATIFSRMPQCAFGPCFDFEDYEPILVVPPQLLQSLNPQWASCSPDIRGVYDPPHALTAAAEAAAPTPIDPGHSSVAAPGSIPQSNQASETALPESGSPASASAPLRPSSTASRESTAGGPGASSADPAPPIISVMEKLPPTASGADPASQKLSVASEDPHTGADLASLIISVMNVSPWQSNSRPNLFGEAADPDSTEESHRDPTDPGIDQSQGDGGAGLGSSEGDALIPSPEAAQRVPIVTISGEEVDVDLASPAKDFIIGGQILQPGQHTDVGGHQIAVYSGVVVVDGSSKFPIPAAPTLQSAVFSANGRTVTAYQDINDGGEVVIGSVTLKEDQSATISGNVITAKPSGLIANGQFVPFGSLTSGSSDQKAIVNIAGHMMTALRSGDNIILESATLHPGEVTTISGTVVSAGSSDVVIGGSTVYFSLATFPTITSNDGGMPLLAGSGSAATKETGAGGTDVGFSDGLTLSIGGPAISIAGHTISDGLNGIVVDGTTTATWSGVAVSGFTEGAVFTLGSDVYTAFEETGSTEKSLAVIGGTALSAEGSAVTVSGQTHTDEPDGVAVTEAGSTILPTRSTAAQISTGTSSRSTTGRFNVALCVTVAIFACLAILR